MPRRVLTICAALLLAAAPAAAARSRAPHLTGVRCVPVNAKTCQAGVAVQAGRTVQLTGRHLRANMRVAFRWDSGALAARLRRRPTGWIATIPPSTRSGAVSVTVRDSAGRRSNARRIRVLAPNPVTPIAATASGLPGVFGGPGMWIWQLPKTEGGDLQRIIARARGAGITTVFIKAADAGNSWAQFSKPMIAALHAGGLRVCGWQFVYGSKPAAEAAAAVRAIATGADCFVVDAESQYEGKYAAAQTYMAAVRKSVGPDYPIGITSFPYVDYHPGLPFSVFLAPGNAQANLPQVYWKDIGTSVDTASAHTMIHNRIFGSAIAPLGQTYQHPSGSEIQRFRAVWTAYGAGGLSWWSWQETQGDTWATLASPAPAAAALPDPGWPLIKRGTSSDEVVWLQQHLLSADPAVTVNGKMDSAMVAAIQRFQAAHALPATGATDAATWQAALSLPFTPVDWTKAR